MARTKLAAIEDAIQAGITDWFIIEANKVAEGKWLLLHPKTGGMDILPLQRGGQEFYTAAVIVFVRSTRVRGARGSLEFGAKLIYEHEGPAYFDCPSEYLRMCPAKNPEWRKRVAAFWASDAPKLNARISKRTKRALPNLSVGQLIEIDGTVATYRVDAVREREVDVYDLFRCKPLTVALYRVSGVLP